MTARTRLRRPSMFRTVSQAPDRPTDEARTPPDHRSPASSASTPPNHHVDHATPDAPRHPQGAPVRLRSIPRTAESGTTRRLRGYTRRSGGPRGPDAVPGSSLLIKMAARIASMTSGSLTTPTTSMRPWQLRHRSASMSHTRRNKSAQAIVAGRRGATGRVAAAASGGVGTTEARQGCAGPKTPKKRRSLVIGSGMSAARRAMRSRG